MSRPIFLNDDLAAARRSFAFFFLLCALGLCLVAALGFYCGMEFGVALRKEAERMEAQKPKRASPATFRPNIFCDREEYGRICRARARMTAVGEK